MVYVTLLIALFKWVAKKKGISPGTVDKAVKALSDPAVKEIVGVGMKKITSNLARKHGSAPMSAQALQNAVIAPAIAAVLKHIKVAPLTIKKALKGLSKKGGVDYFTTQIAKMIKRLGNRPMKNPAKGLKLDITILKANPPRKAPATKKVVKKTTKKNPIASLVLNPKKGVSYRGLTKVKAFALRQRKSSMGNPAKRVPAKLSKKTLSEIKIGNKNAGRHYFSKDTMKFFNSKIHRTIFYIDGVNYFIDSTQFIWAGRSAPRKYSVKRVNPDYTIGNVGENEKYTTLESAKDALKMLKARKVGSKKNPSTKKKVPTKKRTVSAKKVKKSAKKSSSKKAKRNSPSEQLIYPETVSITVIKSGKKVEYNCKGIKVKIMGCKDGSIALRGTGAGAIPANGCKVVEIKARKGTDSLWPNQLFKHKFDTKPLLSVVNGSTLKIKGNKPLHKLFTY